MKKGKISFLLWIFIPLMFSCTHEKFTDNFDNISDRIWIGKNYWAVPMEEWRVKDGRIECIGNIPDMRVNILNTRMKGEGDFQMTIDMGLREEGEVSGTAGVRIGIQDKTDNDIRSLCYFGSGINVGYCTEGFIFIDDQRADLPKEFNPSYFRMNLSIPDNPESRQLVAKFTDKAGNTAEVSKNLQENPKGIIALVNNHFEQNSNGESPKFWFDNLHINGDMAENIYGSSFGPILWTMYTLSDSIMKMSAQFPPVGDKDSREVVLELKKADDWQVSAKAEIDPESRVALFRIEGWNPSAEVEYRVVYRENEQVEEEYYYGTIRKEPMDGNLVMGGLTCQNHYGFPYRPVAENLAKKNPDILYFSGDQIYENNGGYDIIRFPADRAILSYLGKWYMFGWAFGDIMRDRPTICLHDDHEMFQGNLWGNNGETISAEEWEENRDCTSGFVEPLEMVNVVIETNSSHLPDPYDPEPMNNGIKVYYTSLLYGKISFGIVGDRVFKSGPQNVSFWEGRKDHLKFVPKDPPVFEKEGLKFLGDRQIEFLNHWITDWKGAEMKILLSQTLFANATTHHGHEKMILVGDLDSGGWPKSGRDRALEVVNKCFAFHICGDQHISMQIQYGIKDFRDAGWGFCTPAITVGYERRFLPDRLGWPVQNRPEHNLPNTGEYTDGFGNKNYIYAVGNPEDKDNNESRYTKADSRASGFGMIYFDTDKGNIKTESWRFLTSAGMNEKSDMYPGWPVTINPVEDRLNRAKYFLPRLKLENLSKAVVQVIDQKTGELVYITRIHNNSFKPAVFENSVYTVKVGDPEKNIWKSIENLKSSSGESQKDINVNI